MKNTENGKIIPYQPTKDSDFNQGFLFGISQCLQNGCSTNYVKDTLYEAGINKQEIEESSIEDYDKQFLLEVI